MTHEKEIFNTYTYSLSLSLSLFFSSCEREEFKNETLTPMESVSSAAQRGTENEEWFEQKQIVLGGQRTNAYSVATMDSAFAYYNNYLPNSPFQGKQVTATHKYIKILPTTEAHLQILEQIGDPTSTNPLVLQDYPMDYELIEEGDYYFWPATENDLYYPVYTVVPLNYQMPQTLPYEVLDLLYEPTEAEYDVETVALVLADWQEDIVADHGYNVTPADLPSYLDSISKDQLERGRKFTPKGYVKMHNTETGSKNEGLINATISVGRGVWWHYVTTNTNGYFVANKSYRGKVRIRSKWRNATATIRKSWNELLGVQVSDHLMTLTRNNNDRTRTINLGEDHLWYKGTIHNGLMKYNSYAATHGIDKQIEGAIVWAWENGNGSTSTPMLHRYPQLADMAQIAGVTQGAFWAAMTSNLITLLPANLRPDNLYTGLKDKKGPNGDPNTARIEQTVFHESSHYSHARKAGATFWANLFASEINNDIQHGDPYHNGTKPTLNAAKRIAVAEGWATFMEFYMMNDTYGKAWSGGGWQTSPATFMENFNVYDVPMQITRTDNNGWFLTGIFWDLQDPNGDMVARHFDGNGNPLNNIIDNYSISTGTSLQPIFNKLTGRVTSASALKNSLISTGAGSAATAVKINELFTSYGY
ncbi:hypothetical protein [Aequorivita sinensis]|uniref:hypothetical protein n=1 Tax=Aequorivita sinensis TaxID=1382458 RepID=UPI0011227DBB|nr:hypothetical protein [Aequorivita sinensis]